MMKSDFDFRVHPDLSANIRSALNPENESEPRAPQMHSVRPILWISYLDSEEPRACYATCRHSKLVKLRRPYIGLVCAENAPPQNLPSVLVIHYHGPAHTQEGVKTHQGRDKLEPLWAANCTEYYLGAGRAGSSLPPHDTREARRLKGDARLVDHVKVGAPQVVNHHGAHVKGNSAHV